MVKIFRGFKSLVQHAEVTADLGCRNRRLGSGDVRFLWAFSLNSRSPTSPLSQLLFLVLQLVQQWIVVYAAQEVVDT